MWRLLRGLFSGGPSLTEKFSPQSRNLSFIQAATPVQLKQPWRTLYIDNLFDSDPEPQIRSTNGRFEPESRESRLRCIKSRGYHLTSDPPPNSDWLKPNPSTNQDLI